LGSTSDPKKKSVNAGMFVGYYNELQESISNTWRITPEVVAQYHGITKFKSSRHTMWIQAWKDPKNQWLQLQYCINEEDIEMAIRDRHEEWRIPELNREMPVDKETEAEQ
jgi:hypothetical protein